MGFDRNEIVIDVKDVRKRFKVYMDKGLGIKDRLLFLNRNKYEENWVLNGINFQVKKGEAIGLVGVNGCGKSTTLKLINRIMYPTSGNISVKGKVSSLIELGAGFHPDMSGRENIYINASIFGLTRKEIDAGIDDIIAFSELGSYIENPVRTYSSGMYMRLAFSVAINVRADVLLVDEILAVGDVNFQNKCFDKLREIKAQGTTIVIVSHDLAQIEKFCDRTIWIEKGLIRMDGKSKQVHEAYLKDMEEQRVKKMTENRDKNDNGEGRFMGKPVLRNGDRKVEYQRLELYSLDGKATVHIGPRDEIKMILSYRCKDSAIRKVDFAWRIYRLDDFLCYEASVVKLQGEGCSIKEKGEIEVHFKHMDLAAGAYYIDIDIQDDKGYKMDSIHDALDFYVEGREQAGIIDMDVQVNFLDSFE